MTAIPPVSRDKRSHSLRGTTMSKIHNQQAGVYYAGQDFATEPPAFYVERTVARQWLDERKAWSINHGRDIALTPEAEQHVAEGICSQQAAASMVHEESCVMGEHVMDANVEQRLWARRMVRSWKWRVALAAHLRSLKKRNRQKAGIQGIGIRE